MSELWIVLQREFVERVRSRSFVASTVLTPVFFSLFLVVPALTGRPTPERAERVAVVDESRAGIGEAVARAVAAQGGAVELTVLPRPLDEVEDSLLTLLSAGAGVDALLWIPPAVLDAGTASYRVREGGEALRGQLALALSAAVVQARLRRVGVEPALATAVFEPVRLVASRVGGIPGAAPPEEGGILFALMIGFSLYFLILLYGVQVLHSVQEEKSNRIAEVLISSIRASHLMLGKVLGVGFAALLQVAVWLTLALVLHAWRRRLAELLGVPSELFDALRAPADPWIAASMLVFAVLGFFLYSSLFAAAGAAAASAEDAQRFTLPLVAPLLVPVLVAQPIVETPEGTLARVLGWFPLTSPVVMPMRMGAGTPGGWEVAGSLLLLVFSVYALGSLAGKVYRVGILSTGKRPSLGELARWARAG